MIKSWIHGCHTTVMRENKPSRYFKTLSFTFDQVAMLNNARLLSHSLSLLADVGQCMYLRHIKQQINKKDICNYKVAH